MTWIAPLILVVT